MFPACVPGFLAGIAVSQARMLTPHESKDACATVSHASSLCSWFFSWYCGFASRDACATCKQGCLRHMKARMFLLLQHLLPACVPGFLAGTAVSQARMLAPHASRDACATFPAFSARSVFSAVDARDRHAFTFADARDDGAYPIQFDQSRMLMKFWYYG